MSSTAQKSALAAFNYLGLAKYLCIGTLCIASGYYLATIKAEAKKHQQEKNLLMTTISPRLNSPAP